MMRSRMWLVVGVLVLGAVGAECRSSSRVAGPAAASGAEALAARFGACALGQNPANIDFAPPAEFLATAATWLRLDAGARDALEQVNPDGGTVELRLSVRVATSVNDVAPGTTRLVKLHGSQVPGIQWALETAGARVFLPISGSDSFPNYVLVPVIVTPDGSVIFSGECAYTSIWKPLRERYGDANFDARLRAAIGRTGEALGAALGLPRQPAPT